MADQGARLILNPDTEDSQVFELGTDAVTIGRDADCDVVVGSQFVSRRHARVEPSGESFSLVELGSVNPTLVNGERIKGSRQLAPGDRISLADVTFEFWLDDVDINATQVFMAPSGVSTPASEERAGLSRTERMRVDQLFAHGGTVTIMFTDLVDSTTITTAIGDARAQEYLRRHNAMLREEFATYSGLEVKGQGDGFMVVFTSARQAVRCAIAIQRKLATYNAAGPEHPIVVRMGLNLGEVISEGDDFFGTAVILAARISAEARGEEIYASALLRRILEASGEFALQSLGTRALKGFPEEQEIFLVDWRGGASA